MRLSLTEKEWLIQQADESAVSHLEQVLSVSPVLARILYLRGIRSQPEGEAFLNAGLSQLHNPLRIPGMPAAADRLALAIEKRERICVYGDYDVDGVTATSLLVLVLGRLGVEVFPFLPNRMTQGYGLHSEAIREIAASGAELLVTVDNGISAVEEIALARSLGMDVIVTDHHEPPEALPETPFLVNPKIHLGNALGNGAGTRAAQVEPFAALAGVGIAFSLLVAVRARLRESVRWAGKKLPNLREYLDLVAIGTVGDVVPLVSDNRILVAHGLREIERTNNIGLRALLRVSGLMGKPVTPGRVGFVLAPRINAAGRLGDAELALRLLTSRDEREVQQAAALLNQENLKRQEIEKEIAEAASEQVGREGASEKVLVLAARDWHPGVIGIVASRMVGQFYRPAILIAERNGHGTGSGRSIPGFSLYDALHACRESLQGFGGHRMAAGLTLAWDRIPAFRESINRYAQEVLEPGDLVPKIRADGVLEPASISEPLLQELERLKPFGMGNPEPVFLSKGAAVCNPRIVGESHLRFQLSAGSRPVTAIGFNMKDQYPCLQECGSVDLLYHLRVNEYNGSRTIQAVVVDMRPAQPLLK